MKKTAALYSGLAIVTGSTLLLFVFINAAVVLFRRVTSSVPLTARSADSFGTPGLDSHPTLEFMEMPAKNELYNIGFENMRYNRFIHADNAALKINGSVWVFGGSTAFGHGVRDDDTIAAFLNELDPRNAYINFAAQAAHQNYEIDKLVLLLKKGYRPKAVLFIDGLNDIRAMANSNFHPAETPAHLFSSYGYRMNILRVYLPPVSVIISRLPIVDALTRLIQPDYGGSARGTVSAGYEDLNSREALYHADPWRHFQLTSAQWHDTEDLTNIGKYQDKISEYYRLNSRFLAVLAAAFKFRCDVFIQPLGTVSQGNPALLKRPAFRQGRYFRLMLDRIRRDLKGGGLPGFHDISDVDRRVPDGYLDMAHYDPRLARIIAQEILTEMQHTPSRRPGSAKN